MEISNIIDSMLEDSKQNYIDALNSSSDITSRILLTHIYFKFLLERYISTKVKNTKRIFGGRGRGRGMSFMNKLNLVSSFGELDEQLYDGIKKINNMRNNVAHKFKHEVSEDSIDDLARTLGKKYSDIKSKSNDSREILDRTLDTMVVTSQVLSIELRSIYPFSKCK